MPIRLATPSDEPAMALLLATAFFDESLFGPVIHPYRHDYPDDVKIFWSERLRKAWQTRNEKLFVATTTAGENGKEEEKVVGVAVWQRQGDDEGSRKVKESWEHVVPDAFQPLSLTPNRAIDESKRNVLADSFPWSSHHWSGARAQNWYLALCGVDPSYAGQGFGRELVRWGLDRAREEGVHASVVASKGNHKFYLRCGFDEVVGNCTEGKGNPLNGVGGGDILFMYPENKNGAAK